MLYSIGYQGKEIDFFIHTLKKYEVQFLLDVRSKPTSWNPNYRRDSLKKRLEKEGISYSWAGDTLGGFKPILERDLHRLADYQVNKIVCLMCMEADPLQCHRHLKIAAWLKKYGVPVIHL